MVLKREYEMLWGNLHRLLFNAHSMVGVVLVPDPCQQYRNRELLELSIIRFLSISYDFAIYGGSPKVRLKKNQKNLAL